MRVRLLLASTLVFAAACGDKGTAPPPSIAPVDIFTVGDAFSPTFASVAVGGTVRWNFAAGSDGDGHNVRFTPRPPGTPADISVFKVGTQSRTFTTKGTFKYVCDVHPGMQAEVTVE